MASFLNLFSRAINGNEHTPSPAAAGASGRDGANGIEQLLNAAAGNELGSPVQNNRIGSVDNDGEQTSTDELGSTNHLSNDRNDPLSDRKDSLNSKARLPPPDKRLFGENSDIESETNLNENNSANVVTPKNKTPSKRRKRICISPPSDTEETQEHA